MADSTVEVFRVQLLKNPLVVLTERHFGEQGIAQAQGGNDHLVVVEQFREDRRDP
jgi:hypothetical protein